VRGDLAVVNWHWDNRRALTCFFFLLGNDRCIPLAGRGDFDKRERPFAIWGFADKRRFFDFGTASVFDKCCIIVDDSNEHEQQRISFNQRNLGLLVNEWCPVHDHLRDHCRSNRCFIDLGDAERVLDDVCFNWSSNQHIVDYGNAERCIEYFNDQQRLDVVDNGTAYRVPQPLLR